MIDLNERSNNGIYIELLRTVSRIKDLTWIQKAILLEVGYYDIKGLSYTKKQSELIEDLGSSQSCVRRSIKGLEDKGYLSIGNYKSPNHKYFRTLTVNFSKLTNG
jgi:DNA-binding MarR family transcriptional regulator